MEKESRTCRNRVNEMASQPGLGDEEWSDWWKQYKRERDEIEGARK